jgi:hypothetical protein
VRNSSLVKWFRADNVAGLKHTTETAAFTYYLGPLWVQECGWVGERRVASEAAVETSRGGYTSENAGMSSEWGVRNSSTE